MLKSDWLAVKANQRAHFAIGLFVIINLVKFIKILPRSILGGKRGARYVHRMTFEMGQEGI